jgi:hypothetical protein
LKKSRQIFALSIDSSTKKMTSEVETKTEHIPPPRVIEGDEAPKHIGIAVQCEISLVHRLAGYFDELQRNIARTYPHIPPANVSYTVEEAMSYSAESQQALVIMHGFAHDAAFEIIRNDPLLYMNAYFRRVYFLERRARYVETLVDRVLSQTPNLIGSKMRVYAFPRSLELEMVNAFAEKGVIAATSDFDYAFFVVKSVK